MEAWGPMWAPELPLEHYYLLKVQTKSFDGSKVLVDLDSEDVEMSNTLKTDD